MEQFIISTLKKPSHFALINGVALILYSLLYYLITEDRSTGEFPVRLSFLIAVHSVGLMIMSISHAGLKQRKASASCLMGGFVLPIFGTAMVWLLY